MEQRGGSARRGSEDEAARKKRRVGEEAVRNGGKSLQEKPMHGQNGPWGLIIADMQEDLVACPQGRERERALPGVSMLRSAQRGVVPVSSASISNMSYATLRKVSALCKVVRPNHSDRSKKRRKVSWTDLLTILRCFLSFKTVVKSQFLLVFKIYFFQQKMDIRVTDAFMGLAELAGWCSGLHP